MVGDSRQIPKRLVEITKASAMPKAMPNADETTRSTRKSSRGLVRRPPALDHEGREREGEHGPGDVVQRRLGHDRLRHLGADAQALEERDENGGVGGGEDGADEQARLDREVERERCDGARDQRSQQDAGHDEEPDAHGHGPEHAEREPESAVEENHRDPEGQ